MSNHGSDWTTSLCWYPSLYFCPLAYGKRQPSSAKWKQGNLCLFKLYCVREYNVREGFAVKWGEKDGGSALHTICII